jgi:RimJ/RimL family protein N-acetyltransferase
MESGFPLIETEQLLLRPPQLEDFLAYDAIMADAEAAGFTGGDQCFASAWRRFLSSAGARTIQRFSMFSIIEKAGGQWVGRLGRWFPEGSEPGWRLRRCAPNNVPSQALAQRLGSTFPGPGRLPPLYEDSPIELLGHGREPWRQQLACR